MPWRLGLMQTREVLMPILRRATENRSSDFREIPPGVYRVVVEENPEVYLDEKYNKYQAKFTLSLTESERSRLMAEHPMPSDAPEGMQQSWRVWYRCGLSLGFIDRQGNYRSTRLVDFLAPCFGQENQRKFRKFIESGGGPPKPADPDDPDQEIAAIAEWLKWWGGLELYGAINHTPRDDGGVWTNFGGPLAVGSLPNDKDPEYQAFGRGKLAAMLAEYKGAEEQQLPAATAVEVPKRVPVQRSYQEIFGTEDEPL